MSKPTLKLTRAEFEEYNRCLMQLEQADSEVEIHSWGRRAQEIYRRAQLRAETSKDPQTEKATAEIGRVVVSPTYVM